MEEEWLRGRDGTGSTNAVEISSLPVEESHLGGSTLSCLSIHNLRHVCKHWKVQIVNELDRERELDGV